MRLLVPAVLGIALLAPVAPRAGALPTLAGETVITADGPSTMRISVPVATRISVDPTKAVSISGPGRLVGNVLRENREDYPDEALYLRMPPQLGGKVVGWGPATQVAGCTSPLPGGLYTDCSNAKIPTYYTLHRGTYTLSVLTDGAPLTVTLRALNLSGSTVLEPTKRVGAGFAPFAKTVDQPAAFSGGATVRPTQAAYLFTLAWWQQDESAAAQNGACWYGGDGFADLGDKGWLPGCPGASMVSSGEIRNPIYGAWGAAKGGQHGGLGTASTAGPDTVGLSAWAVAQNIRNTGGFAVWLGQ